MLLRRRHREVPELNTTSTADISFMLLVFFLVTSSMDADSGLGRQLAPTDERQELRDISRQDVLRVTLDATDQLYCDGRAVSARELRQEAASFVASRQSGHYVIAVEADGASSYDAYFRLQNELVAAYRGLRDQLARRRYGHDLAHCTPEERQAVMAHYPQRISEGVQDE